MPKGERFFSIMGNLDWVIPRFINLVPPYKNRVEVTFGAGEYIYHADPPLGLEVANDIDKTLIRMHIIVKNLTREQHQQLSQMDWTMSKETFNTLRHSQPQDDIEFLHKYVYLFCARNKERPVDEAVFFTIRGGIGYESTADRIWKAHERFKNLIIENMDALDCIKKYDSPDTFFFLDPPYIGKERYYTEHSINWEELCDLLRQIKGKFLLVTSTQVDFDKIAVGTDYVIRSRRAFWKLCEDYTHTVYSNPKALNSILKKKVVHHNYFHVVYNWEPYQKFRSFFK